MSLFKTKAIILKISKVRERDFIYDIFTYDYGKIKVQKKEWKKEKSLDLGYIISCEIETKESRDIHKIKNLKIKSEFSYLNKDFAVINEYLNIIGIVYQKIPFWLEFKDVFELLEELNNQTSIDEIKLVLARLKVIDLIWELRIEDSDKTVEKILKFINKNRLKEIFRLTWIDNDLKEKLKKL